MSLECSYYITLGALAVCRRGLRARALGKLLLKLNFEFYHHICTYVYVYIVWISVDFGKSLSIFGG
jgi:hypothetical protein